METIATDALWTGFAPVRMAGLPIGRRSAVARAAGGGLVLFSPLPFSDDAAAAIRARGNVIAIVVPSRFHVRFYEPWFGAFPSACVVASAGVAGDHPGWRTVDPASKSALLAGFRWHTLAGMPAVEETVFLHEASRSLIIADLLFCTPRPKGLAGLLAAAAGIGGHPPRPSRLWRSLVRDRQAFAASLREVLAWDFDRIVPGHGTVVPSGGRATLAAAFSGWTSGKM